MAEQEKLSSDEITALCAIDRGIVMSEPYESIKDELVKRAYAETFTEWRLTEKGTQALDDHFHTKGESNG